MNNELLEALTLLEREKHQQRHAAGSHRAVSDPGLQESFRQRLTTLRLSIDPRPASSMCWAEKTVVEEVTDDVTEISPVQGKDDRRSSYELGDIVNVEIQSKEFGRIATQNAKNVILQKIREEERKVLFNEYYSMEKDVVTGIVQRYLGKKCQRKPGQGRRHPQ